jgi:hypothetical protein
MTRKLRNSITALLLTSTLCSVGALSVAALPFGVGHAPSQPAPAAPESTLTGMDAAGSAPREAAPVRRMRPSVGMPYFSFMPRG